MRLLVELNVGLFFASVAILFFVLRYRVHLHLEYAPRTRKNRRMRAQTATVVSRSGKNPPQEARQQTEPSWTAPTQMVTDLESALVNLGASKPEARKRATAAMAQGPAGFDALLFRAMQSR